MESGNMDESIETDEDLEKDELWSNTEITILSSHCYSTTVFVKKIHC